MNCNTAIEFPDGVYEISSTVVFRMPRKNIKIELSWPLNSITIYLLSLDLFFFSQMNANFIKVKSLRRFQEERFQRKSYRWVFEISLHCQNGRTSRNVTLLC